MGCLWTVEDWTAEKTIMTNLEKRAKIFATRAHEGQLRKYTQQPYIMHPADVANIVRGVPHTEEMLAAAWLHDVVEDCGVTLETIALEISNDVACLVGWLSDVSTPNDGNRKVRKAIDRNHIANAPADAQTVKIADLISNTESLVKYDPDFARVYLREKNLLLNVLTKGDRTLWQRARKLCDDGLKALDVRD